MESAWAVMGFSYLLSAIVAMFVAALIHLLVKLIRSFNAKPAAVATNEVEIAIAIAAALQKQGK